MKNSNICIKCNSSQVRRVKALPVKVTFARCINPYYYICCDCGYTEIWLEDKAELEIIINKKEK